MNESTRSLRRSRISYTETRPNSYSQMECDDEYNNNRNTNTWSNSTGSIESTPITDTPTPMPNQVAPESSSSRKRIQHACDNCRRKKSKCTGGEICSECSKVQGMCHYSKSDNSEANRMVSYRELRVAQESNKLLEWLLRESHARSIEFPERRPPAEFSQYIPWLRRSPVTAPFDVEKPSTNAKSFQNKRPQVRKTSIKQSNLDQDTQELLNTAMADTTAYTEHDSGQTEAPHFRESQPALDIDVIDNRLDVHAYDQECSPSPPVIANKIDYSMPTTQPSFDQSFYPESHSPYTASTMQSDPWNDGRMVDTDQMATQDMLYSRTQYYPANDHYDYPYSHQQQ